jgi:hypothetical protein
MSKIKFLAFALAGAFLMVTPAIAADYSQGKNSNGRNSNAQTQQYKGGKGSTAQMPKGSDARQSQVLKSGKASPAGQSDYGQMPTDSNAGKSQIQQWKQSGAKR